ncbi:MULTISPECIES: hypothetical protein [Haloarcula]|uniref:hypothetical protein n=1 Tax=Haloarcula TaxID=2237 RepID=UPI0023E86584|nr:hypothetical protein [Halomicroarcula sp. SHR3]
MPILSQALKLIVLSLAQLVLVPLQWLGIREARYAEYWVDQWLLGFVRWEAGVNEGFREATQSLTAPFGGVLRQIGNSLLATETGINGVADLGLRIAGTLDPVIRELRDATEINILGVDVSVLPESLAAFFTIIDIPLNLFFGGVWHGLFTIPAAIAGHLSNFFHQLSQFTPIEMASGFLGGILLLILVGIGVPTLLYATVNFAVQLLLLPIRAFTRFFDEDKAKPTMGMEKRIIGPFVNRVMGLITMVSLVVVFLTYPFFNTVGVLLFATIGIAFVVLGELQDQATLYAFGLVMAVLGIPAFLLEVPKFGIVATVVIGLVLVLFISLGTDRLEKEAASIVTETA